MKLIKDSKGLYYCNLPQQFINVLRIKRDDRFDVILSSSSGLGAFDCDVIDYYMRLHITRKRIAESPLRRVHRFSIPSWIVNTLQLKPNDALDIALASGSIGLDLEFIISRGTKNINPEMKPNTNTNTTSNLNLSMATDDDLEKDTDIGKKNLRANSMFVDDISYDSEETTGGSLISPLNPNLSFGATKREIDRQEALEKELEEESLSLDDIPESTKTIEKQFTEVVFNPEKSLLKSTDPALKLVKPKLMTKRIWDSKTMKWKEVNQIKR